MTLPTSRRRGTQSSDLSVPLRFEPEAGRSKGITIRGALALCHCTVIGLATRGIMMIESCNVIEATEK
jgi:hypothetical protein